MENVEKQSYQKDYYEKNKQKILNKMYQSTVCDVCNCKVLFCNLPKHKRTKKCMKARANTEPKVLDGDVKQQIEQMEKLLANLKNKIQ